MEDTCKIMFPEEPQGLKQQGEHEAVIEHLLATLLVVVYKKYYTY